MKIATLQTQIKDKIGYEPSYKKTQLDKQMAIAKSFSGWNKSYICLRKYINATLCFNLETIVIIENDRHQVENGA